nr:hypothetical protein [Tanacetum cinerariifolium]
MRIEQYIQMIDYAQREVTENDATLPKTQVVEDVTTLMPITTVEEKTQRRLKVKARSTLMISILNQHQLKFNSIKDTKQLLEAVEKRFGGNEATKKTQRNLLKQQYENFIASSLEMLDQTIDSLQKLMSQLDLLDEKLSQEDVNQKLLRSLSLEWNTHDVVWRNKADLDTMSMDDLYNNLKAEEGPNYALMAFSSLSSESKVFNDSTCLKSCLKTVKLLKSLNEQLLKDLKKYELMVLDEFANKLAVENFKVKSSEEEIKVVKKNNDAPIIEEWVSDDEEENVSQPKIEKKIVKPNIVKKEFVKSKQQEKTARKTIK